MKTSSPRSRRHRNPPVQEVQAEQQPFFSRGHATPSGLQAKQEAFFQPKLTIGQADDHYEREADAVADQVVGNQSAGRERTADASVQREAMPEEKRIQEKPSIQKAEAPQKEEEKPAIQKKEEKQEEETPTVQKAEAEKKEEENPAVQMMEAPEKEEEGTPALQKAEAPPKEEEKPVQKKSEPSGSVASPAVAAQIQNSRGQGSRLPTRTKAQMEQAFGRDFSEVKIHTDPASEEMNETLQAQAFTTGKDIYFNAGKFSPETAEGKHLLAHELTHVVQQNADTLALKKNPLKNYTINQTVFYKAEESVDAALKNSSTLGPYITGQKKKGFSIQDKVEYTRSEKDFESRFRSANANDTYSADIRGFYDRNNNKIVVAPNPTIEILIHESIHKLSSGITRHMGQYLNEGFTQIFTNAVLKEYGLGTGKAYEDQVKGASLIQAIVGFATLGKTYFLSKNLVFDELRKQKPKMDWVKLIRSKSEADVREALQ